QLYKSEEENGQYCSWPLPPVRRGNACEEVESAAGCGSRLPLRRAAIGDGTAEPGAVAAVPSSLSANACEEVESAAGCGSRLPLRRAAIGDGAAEPGAVAAAPSSLPAESASWGGAGGS
ncbi:hypothetical protein LEMLEM_LOCUS13281, partial [Lemmus lemmus]